MFCMSGVNSWSLSLSSQALMQPCSLLAANCHRLQVSEVSPSVALLILKVLYLCLYLDGGLYMKWELIV